MKRTFWLAIVAVLLSNMAAAQSSPTPQTTPSNVEVLKPSKEVDLRDVKVHLVTMIAINQQLELIKKDAELQATKQSEPIHFQGNLTEKEIQDWIAARKAENGWGNDVTFNRQKLQFERTVVVVQPVDVKPKPLSPADQAKAMQDAMDATASHSK